MDKKVFLEKVERFLASKDISPTMFGTKSLSDPMFVFMLREGRECREKTQKRVLDFMKKYRKIR